MSTEEAASPGVQAARACINHPQREAVARCPECARFFCRECITEHDFRMICASCLAKALDGPEGTENGRAPRLNLPVVPVVQGLFAVGFVWFLFYSLGQTLLEIPADVHEGTLFGDTFEAIFTDQ